jgi:hypothetical protein
MPHPMVIKLAKTFKTRAEFNNMKGKGRDNAAIEFFVGAMAALEAPEGGDRAAYDAVAIFTTMLLCTRGYNAILSAAKDGG